MRLCCETQGQTESALPSVRVHPWKNAGSHRAASFAAIFYRFEQAARLLALLTLACIPLGAQRTRAAATAARPAFVFGGVSYLHRWSQNDQHEFTPEGQEDLKKWADMITMNAYPSAHDGDALAAKANAVLENYKSHGGRMLRTNSVPRTPDQPAEHFIAVVFGRSNFIEVAFARLKLVDGVGLCIRIVFTARKSATK